jgi:hypothetical protein
MTIECIVCVAFISIPAVAQVKADGFVKKPPADPFLPIKLSRRQGGFKMFAIKLHLM